MNETGSDRTRVRRNPKRGLYDRESLYAVLDAGRLAHVAFVHDGAPVSIPLLYGRGGDRLYLHAATSSRMFRSLADGTPISLSVAIEDGLVLARSAFHHSMNYRSAVVFGSARSLKDDQEKVDALRTISEHLIPGRWDEVRAPNPTELKATGLLVLVLKEASVKMRSGAPVDEAEDMDLPIWAGVVPMKIVYGDPEPDPMLASDTASAPSVQALLRANR